METPSDSTKKTATQAGDIWRPSGKLSLFLDLDICCSAFSSSRTTIYRLLSGSRVFDCFVSKFFQAIYQWPHKNRKRFYPEVYPQYVPILYSSDEEEGNDAEQKEVEEEEEKEETKDEAKDGGGGSVDSVDVDDPGYSGDMERGTRLSWFRVPGILLEEF
ncbi:unnamed protein product [Pylaiella littoralis]